MKFSLFVIALCASLFAALAGATGPLPERVSVGYFQQWPTPSQFSQLKKTYDYALDTEVNWIPFASGSEMNAALAAGKIQIAYSHGHVPFLVGVSNGLDLTMIGIAVGYSENDNCILRDDAGIDRLDATQFDGLRIAVPLGGVTHFRLLEMLAHLRVDIARVEIVAVGDAAAAAATLRRGDVGMACAYGNDLRGIADLGQPLMSAAELEAIGLKVFDIVTVATDFMQEYPDLVQAFMDVTEASNQQWKKNPAPMQATIARAADMDPPSAAAALARMSLPSAGEQKSDAWLGDLVPTYTKKVADFFVAQGRLKQSLDSYERFITTRFLR